MLDFEREAHETLREMTSMRIDVGRERKAMKEVVAMINPRKHYEEQFMLEDYKSDRSNNFVIVRNGMIKEVSLGFFFLLNYDQTTLKLEYLKGSTFSSIQPQKLSSLMADQWRTKGSEIAMVKMLPLIFLDSGEKIVPCFCLPLMVPNSQPSIEIVYKVLVNKDSEYPLIGCEQSSGMVTEYNQHFVNQLNLDENLVYEAIRKNSAHSK